MSTATASAPAPATINLDQIRAFHTDGFTVVRSLVGPARAAVMRDHFMALRAEGPKPGDMGGDPRSATDPLNRFPRMIHMNKWDSRSQEWATNPAVVAAASALIGQQAVLNQTMLYFKPPGARGQAMHQDQQYITIDPLIGAWCALDRCDKANGQMVMLLGSHRHGVLPVCKADSSASFTDGGTVIPDGLHEVGIDMEPGDVLFFTGATIHGSYPNTTTDRFRRCFICHFVGAQATSFTPAHGTNMRHLAP